MKIVNLKNDLADAQDSLAEDQKFAAEVKKGCATAEVDYEERKKNRAQEAVAISETIKILNDDDALDLFKNTLALTQKSKGILAGRGTENLPRKRRKTNKADKKAVDYVKAFRK